MSVALMSDTDSGWSLSALSSGVDVTPPETVHMVMLYKRPWVNPVKVT